MIVGIIVGIVAVAVQLLGILTGSLRVTDRNLVIVYLRIAIGCKRNLELDGWRLGVVSYVSVLVQGHVEVNAYNCLLTGKIEICDFSFFFCPFFHCCRSR